MDNLFFYSAKILWMLLSPDSLFVLLLLLGLLLLFFNYRPQALAVFSIITLSVLALTFFRIGDMMLYPLETRFAHNPRLPDKVDGIIVLGGSVIPDPSIEWQQLQTNSSHERLSSFIYLAQRFPDAKLVFTGGNASLFNRRASEAELVREYFLSSGIDADRLHLEDQSRNTAENASFSKALIEPAKGETWLLITTAFHMPRSVGVFCRENWGAIPYPVDHQTLPSKLYDVGYNLIGNVNNFIQATHEWGGLVVYFLTGKTDRLLPEGCH